MKISGRELRLFMADPKDGGGWPMPGDDWYWDHDVFEEPSDDAEYETDDIGPLMYQGSGEDPTRGNNHNLATLIKKWRRDRDYDVLTLMVPKTDTERVKRLLVEAGVKV